MKQKFLFVDDDAMIIGAIERLVANEPFEFHWFQSPVLALEKVAEIRPQVILSDQRMPEMNGIQFLAEVRKKLPDTTRMILTGYHIPEYAEGALFNGDVAKFLSKPWDNATLIQEIRDAFRCKESAQSHGVVCCDICGTKCAAQTIQVHKSFHLCLRCKKKAEPLTDDMLHIVASFFEGNAPKTTH